MPLYPPWRQGKWRYHNPSLVTVHGAECLSKLQMHPQSLMVVAIGGSWMPQPESLETQLTHTCGSQHCSSAQGWHGYQQSPLQPPCTMGIPLLMANSHFPHPYYEYDKSLWVAWQGEIPSCVWWDRSEGSETSSISSAFIAVQTTAN